MAQILSLHSLDFLKFIRSLYPCLTCMRAPLSKSYDVAGIVKKVCDLMAETDRILVVSM